MRWDYENQVCNAQAFTGAATVSQDSIKKGSAAEDISIGRRMAFLFCVEVAAGAGSTHTFEAIQADDAALTSNVQVIGSTTGILAADLYKGAMIEIPIRQESITKQYLGIRNTATGGVTTVTGSAYLVPQDEIPAKKVSFPKINNAEVQ